MDLRLAARAAFVVTTWLFVACTFIQVFLAGLGVFAGAQNFATHRDFGYLFGLLTLVMLVLALVGRMPRRFVGMTIVLIVLFALQSVFIVAWRSGAPAIAALHPVNALLIVAVATALAVRARPLAPRPLGTADTARSVADERAAAGVR